MAPELLFSEDSEDGPVDLLTESSDIYALAIVLWQVSLVLFRSVST